MSNKLEDDINAKKLEKTTKLLLEEFEPDYPNLVNGDTAPYFRCNRVAKKILDQINALDSSNKLNKGSINKNDGSGDE